MIAFAGPPGRRARRRGSGQRAPLPASDAAATGRPLRRARARATDARARARERKRESETDPARPPPEARESRDWRESCRVKAAVTGTDPATPELTNVPRKPAPKGGLSQSHAASPRDSESPTGDSHGLRDGPRYGSHPAATIGLGAARATAAGAGRACSTARPVLRHAGRRLLLQNDPLPAHQSTAKTLAGKARPPRRASLWPAAGWPAPPPAKRPPALGPPRRRQQMPPAAQRKRGSDGPRSALGFGL